MPLSGPEQQNIEHLMPGSRNGVEMAAPIENIDAIIQFYRFVPVVNVGRGRNGAATGYFGRELLQRNRADPMGQGYRVTFGANERFAPAGNKNCCLVKNRPTYHRSDRNQKRPLVSHRTHTAGLRGSEQSR